MPGLVAPVQDTAEKGWFTVQEDLRVARPAGGDGAETISNSNLVEEMTSLLAVQRTYQANQAVLAKLDGTLDQAAGELGRL